MKEHDSTIAIRLPSEKKLRIEQLIAEGKVKSISQVVRIALKEFLSKEGESPR